MKTRFILTGIITFTFYTQSMSVIHSDFFIINKESKMPVVIRGNVDSRVLILFLHGGPGGSAMQKIGTRAFNGLEKEFGVIYWDQRGAEGSKGGAQKKYMNLNQFVEDLNLLVDRIHNMHPHAQLFLMGHSWGGGFGTAYLMDSTRQSKITGWIDMAGAHNNPKGDSLSAEWVKDYANKKIKQGEKIRYWKRALRWYEKNPEFLSNAMRHYSFVRKSNGYQLVKGDTLGKYHCYNSHDLFKKPVKYVTYYLKYYKTLNRLLISDMDMTPSMKNITLPCLILWGNKDGIIPVAMAVEALDVLGTAPSEKKLVIFDKTAHTIYYEQSTLFVKAVKDFVLSTSVLAKNQLL